MVAQQFERRSVPDKTETTAPSSCVGRSRGSRSGGSTPASACRRVSPWLLLRAQARRFGALPLLGLPAAAALMAALGLWGRTALAQEEAFLLTAALGQLFLISCGVFAASLLAGDALGELHESTPAGFRATQLARLVLVVITTILGGILLYVPLSWDGALPFGGEWATILVEPLGSALIVCLVAFCVATFSGSTQAAVLASLSMWFFLSLFWDPNIVGGLALRRGLPLAVMLLVAAWAIRCLGKSERTIEMTLRAEAE